MNLRVVFAFLVTSYLLAVCCGKKNKCPSNKKECISDWGNLNAAITNAPNGTETTIVLCRKSTIPFGDEPIFITGNKTLNICCPVAKACTLDGRNTTQLFYIDDANANVAFSGGIIFANGRSSDGGAVFNGGTLTITETTFSGNNAVGGGAVFNGGTLTITETTFSGNNAVSGGAVYNDGTLNITDTTFSGNTARVDGGAIVNGGVVTITETTFSGNTATEDQGGAILNDGTLTITDTTFSGNTARVDGGAIVNDGTLIITTTTFKNNTAANSVSNICYNSGTVDCNSTTNVFCGTTSGNEPSELCDGATVNTTC